MSTDIDNPALARMRKFTIIHAHALREYLNDDPSHSRKCELVEIVRECERQYPLLALFREAEPICADFDIGYGNDN